MSRKPEVEVSENGDGSIDVTIKLRSVNMTHNGYGKFGLFTYHGPAGFKIPYRGQNMITRLHVSLSARFLRKPMQRSRFSFMQKQRPHSELVVV